MFHDEQVIVDNWLLLKDKNTIILGSLLYSITVIFVVMCHTVITEITVSVGLHYQEFRFFRDFWQFPPPPLMAHLA